MLKEFMRNMSYEELHHRNWYSTFTYFLMRDRAELAKHMIDKGNVMSFPSHVVETSQHPLDCAVTNKDPMVMKMLLNYGFKLEEVRWFRLNDKREKFKTFKAVRCNTVFTVCWNGNDEVIRFVLNRPEITKQHINFQVEDVCDQFSHFRGVTPLLNLV
jgi:hypothetical protein